MSLRSSPVIHRIPQYPLPSRSTFLFFTLSGAAKMSFPNLPWLLFVDPPTSSIWLLDLASKYLLPKRFFIKRFNPIKPELPVNTATAHQWLSILWSVSLSPAIPHQCPIKLHLHCLSTNVAYLINCKKCGLQYIGETKRTLKSRVLEHCGDTKQKRDKLVARHFNLSKHTAEDILIMDIDRTSKNDTYHKLAFESYWIEKLNTFHPFGINVKGHFSFLSFGQSCQSPFTQFIFSLFLKSGRLGTSCFRCMVREPTPKFRMFSCVNSGPPFFRSLAISKFHPPPFCTNCVPFD